MAEQLDLTPEPDEDVAPQALAGAAATGPGYSDEDLDGYRAVDSESETEAAGESENEGDESTYGGGPAEYVQSERGGRPRRIGSEVSAEAVDYKNVTQLSQFLDRRGRILARRKTRVSAKVQRRVAVAIKRARHLALLPYTADQTRIVRRRR